MKRDIKFRIWCETDEGMEMMYLEPMECDNGLWFNATKHITEYQSIMQYSGVEDMNHKPIYEGDIIIDYRKHSEIMQYWICKFNNGCFNFWNRGTQMIDIDTTSFEVVGNIFQRTELIARL